MPVGDPWKLLHAIRCHLCSTYKAWPCKLPFHVIPSLALPEKHDWTHFTDKTMESQGFVQGHRRVRGRDNPGSPPAPQGRLPLWTHAPSGLRLEVQGLDGDGDKGWR